jgi:hypothetical protein
VKLAAWCLTKSTLLAKERGHTTHQSCIDLSKVAWILSEVLPPDATMDAESKSVNATLLQLLKEELHAQRKDGAAQFSPFEIEADSFRLLEPMQPEERGLMQFPEKETAITENLLRDESSYSFRALVAVDFGVVIPTQCATESERNYILTMTLHREEQHVTIAVCNQMGHLVAVNMLSDVNFPLVSGTDVSNWFILEFHRHPSPLFVAVLGRQGPTIQSRSKTHPSQSMAETSTAISRTTTTTFCEAVKTPKNHISTENTLQSICSQRNLQKRQK